MTTDLREVLRDELDHLPIPSGDLTRARARGTVIRRGRRATVAAVGVLAAGVVAGVLLLGSDTGSPAPRGLDPVGRLDFSHGVRAYADPGFVVHLGGREFPADSMDFIDTDAVATPYGVLYYDDGRPMLLDETGEFTDLEPGADGASNHPAAKTDSQNPWVAYAVTQDGETEVVVRDLASDVVVGRHPVDGSTVIDALDGGVVMLRTAEGTVAWDTGTDEVQAVAGARTRVADVRDGVLLYDGPVPDGPAASSYRLVPGAIDAQLTYDGEHVLSWSHRLESTTGGAPIVLDQKATFFAIDTDGSILAATYGHPATVYDCEVPTGRCTELGPLTTRGGDPAFIGTDM